MISPVGGRDDYAALFHEGGHTEHYAHVGSRAAVRVPPPRRQLGDRGASRSCFEHLTEDPAWLEAAPRRDRAGPIRRLRARERSSSSCAATRPSSPTSWSCTRPRPISRRCRSATRACSATRSGARGRGRPGSPTSTRASTSPTTCAPGRSRRPGGGRCASASASAGSRSPRRRVARGLWRQGQRLAADELLRDARRGARLRGAGGGVRRGRCPGLWPTSRKQGGLFDGSNRRRNTADGQRSPAEGARRPSQGRRQRHRRGSVADRLRRRSDQGGLDLGDLARPGPARQLP